MDPAVLEGLKIMLLTTTNLGISTRLAMEVHVRALVSLALEEAKGDNIAAAEVLRTLVVPYMVYFAKDLAKGGKTPAWCEDGKLLQ